MTKIFRLIFIAAILFFTCSCEDKKEKDTTPPTITITYPVSGSTVNGQIAIRVDANDNVGVVKVEFLIDGVLKGTDVESPWEYIWSTGQYGACNQHSIIAKAQDEAGNVTSSSIVLVLVSSGNTSTVTDIDGNLYQTIQIGNQVWMAENLKVTHYCNGESIPNVTAGSEWDSLTTGAYCNFDNDTNIVATYGRLYNWYAVNDSRNLAPIGWHVPSAEYNYIIIFLSHKDKINSRHTYAVTVG